MGRGKRIKQELTEQLLLEAMLTWLVRKEVFTLLFLSLTRSRPFYKDFLIT